MAKTSTYTAKTPGPDGRITYSSSEDLVWRDLYAQQEPNIRKWSAPEYIAGFDRLALPSDRVPQCTEISEVLGSLTGWRVEPVPALIGFSRFFAMLADRTFPAASFIRSREDFNYIKEPDIFHEIFGHTPLLTDKRFANFSKAIGEAGAKLEPRDFSWLIRLYWFTIEFGLTRKDDTYKALGSGLASSPTELPYSVESPGALRRPFDVIDILRTPYRIDIHQPVYFVLDKVDDLFEAAERDLVADIRTAQSKGLFAPLYPEKQEA